MLTDLTLIKRTVITEVAKVLELYSSQMRIKHIKAVSHIMCNSLFVVLFKLNIQIKHFNLAKNSNGKVITQSECLNT